MSRAQEESFEALNGILPLDRVGSLWLVNWAHSVAHFRSNSGWVGYYLLLYYGRVRGNLWNIGLDLDGCIFYGYLVVYLFISFICYSSHVDFCTEVSLPVPSAAERHLHLHRYLYWTGPKEVILPSTVFSGFILESDTKKKTFCGREHSLRPSQI